MLMDQVLTGIRTVSSLTSEEAELKRYDEHLQGAYAAGVKEAIAAGFTTGLYFTTTYLALALAYWYGTKQVLGVNTG